MGGVRIDPEGRTNLEGLFAAGEDSSGVHGANRLGGNGVAESTVFGARVGDAAARHGKRGAFEDLPGEQIAEAQERAEMLLRADGENPFSLRDDLGRLMWEQVGIVRSAAKLNDALAKIRSFTARAERCRGPGGRAFN